MLRLSERRGHLKETAAKVAQFLKENKSSSVPDFSAVLEDSKILEQGFAAYKNGVNLSEVDETNSRQRALHGKFAPFFALLHELLKTIDKEFRHIEKESKSKDLKTLKAELDDLHREIREIEYFFGHINWLQERFPEARYEDVTGLCKLASLDEIKEQEYSLNPGRYVGVVIEEDGKTEEEFIEEMLSVNEELSRLNAEARELEGVINHNVLQIAGEG